MKIIHCADIHIGSVMENLPDDKAKIRQRELTDTFFNMLGYAGNNGVGVIIIAGDFFDRRNIARSVKQEVFNKISDFPEIRFLYLSGNHDKNCDLDGVIIPKNFIKIDGVSDWAYFDYKDICIAAADLQKQTDGGLYEKLKLNKDNFNIAVLHGSPAEIRFDRLKGKNIDYLALGDRHIPDREPQKLDLRGQYAYCGCIEGRGFDEIGGRGFFLLDINDGKMKRTFLPASKRKHEIVEVDITNARGHSDIETAVGEKTDKLDKNDIIRVVLKGKHKADTVRDAESLERKLNERFFWAQVKDESRLDMSSVDYKNEISLRYEFVKLVNESGLTQAEKEKIIECGVKALGGEDAEL